jgi:uncharacterized protein (DUF58 family)
VVDGFISGLHRAVNMGASTDFAEHRAYVPGDDVRHIDWRVYARTDRLYLKTFEAETNADVFLALDTSGSMAYAGRTVSKFDYGRFVVASLAHLAARQRDRVGLALFDTEVRDWVPPSTRRRDLLLRHLDRAEARGSGNLPSALHGLVERLQRRGIVVVVSDFYAPSMEAVSAMDELRVRGHDVVALHVLDPVERDLSLPDLTVLEDMESGERMPVSTAVMGDEYRAALARHLDKLGQASGERRIDYACLHTDQPLDSMLYRYLAQRARLRRTR